MNEDTKQTIEDAAAERQLDGVPQTEIEDGSLQARIEATQPGWPVETADGERVLIVAKESTPAGDILIDADGNKYAAAPNTAAGTVALKLDENGRLDTEGDLAEDDLEEDDAA